MKNKKAVLWPSGKYLITCDSCICAYCAESYLSDVAGRAVYVCDSVTCTGYDEFVGVEAYKTVEDTND